MAGEPYRFIGTGEDFEPGVTLGLLRDRIDLAVRSGVPLDTPVVDGYSREFLEHCLYLKKPDDLTKMSYDDVKRRAMSTNHNLSGPAWAEIDRRITEREAEDEHLAMEGKA